MNIFAVSTLVFLALTLCQLKKIKCIPQYHGLWDKKITAMSLVKSLDLDRIIKTQVDAYITDITQTCIQSKILNV